MKKIFTPIFLLFSFNLCAQDGKIDSTFGTDGRVSTSVGGTVNAAQQKIIVQSTGKILQAFAVNDNFGIVRYNNDDPATLDATFGGTGIVTIDFSDIDGATSMIVQGDGKIVVAGYSGSNFAVARLNTNGTLDATFDGDGRVTTSFGAGTSSMSYSVNLQSDGKIILAGYNFAAGVGTFALARYNTNGSLDNTFDTDGLVTTNFNGINDQAFASVIQTDGKIVSAGFSQLSGGSVFALARYNPNGSLDTGFDGDGKLSTAFGNDAGASAITIQADNKIIAAGYGTGSPNNLDFALSRYNTNGSLDNTFDADGKVLTPIGTGNDMIYSIGIQSDGRILVGGSTFNSVDNDFAIARYTAAGTPDATFDVDGKNSIDFGGAEDNGYSIGSQGINIIVGGTVGTSLGLTRITNSSFILPVFLYSFAATKQNSAVLLNWQTFNEQYTAAFEVQRSADGRSFATVGAVSSAGTTSFVKNYSLTDLQPAQGVNYYRLKMIDTDGKFTFSKIIVVRFDNAAITLQAFPNPVKNIVNLQFNAPAGKVKLQLVDAIGRTIKTSEIQSSGSAIYTSMDMTNLRKGIYYIYVNGENIKVIKE